MNLKKFISRALALGLLLSAFPSVSLSCGLDWTLPLNHFDGVNERGNLSYWEKIGLLNLPDGSDIPLNMNFNSARSASSPYLGEGWSLTLLESNVVQMDERRFLMVLPDGLNIRLKKKTAADAVMSGQGGWMAQVSDNTLTAWAPCGWKLVFVNGKIISITTPKDKELVFNYQNGVVKEIDEDQVPILSVISDSTSGAVSAITFNGNQINFDAGKMPNVQSVNGQNIVGEINSSLGKLTYADGTIESFQYSLDPGLIPTMKIKGTNNRSFSWDPSSRLLTKDGNWTYKITPGATALENAQIGRTNMSGQQEFWYNNKRTGEETIQDIRGNKTIIEKFVNAGPLNGRIRSETSYTPGGVVAQKKLFSYDEKFKLIRVLQDLVIVDDAGSQQHLAKVINY